MRTIVRYTIAQIVRMEVAVKEVETTYARAFMKTASDGEYSLYRFLPYEFHCAWKELNKDNEWFQLERCYLEQASRRFPETGTEFTLYRSVDLLTGITITSEVDTEVIVRSNEWKLFSFPIKKGTHTYPLYLFMCWSIFSSLKLHFDVSVVFEGIKARIFPNKIRFMELHKFVDIYQYSTVTRSGNGMTASPFPRKKVDLTSLGGICWNCIRINNIPVKGMLPNIILDMAESENLYWW